MKIREQAASLWISAGRPTGRDTEFWLTAEKFIVNTHATFVAEKEARAATRQAKAEEEVKQELTAWQSFICGTIGLAGFSAVLAAFVSLVICAVNRQPPSSSVSPHDWWYFAYRLFFWFGGAALAFLLCCFAIDYVIPAIKYVKKAWRYSTRFVGGTVDYPCDFVTGFLEKRR